VNPDSFLNELKHPPQVAKKKISPPPKASLKGSPIVASHGTHLLKEGKGALVVLAGGVGTRLGHHAPKGCFEVTRVRKKTLYQLIYEKVKAASHLVGRPLPVAIMTSGQTDQETREYFKKIGEEQFQFFLQSDFPVHDEEGKSFIGFSPSGNGDLFASLKRSPLFQEWKERGIQFVQVIAVDNPLALPFDPELFGFHDQEGNEATLVVGKRVRPEEKTGVIATVDGSIQVVEYMELNEEQREIVAYPYANFGIYIFNLDFIERMSKVKLPIHVAHKRVEGVPCRKYERFIFDVLPFSKKSSLLLAARVEAFAPLKNSIGEDTIDAVQSQMLEADREAFFRVAGIRPDPKRIFELDPTFYYPSADLLKRWQGKSLPETHYIEA
jgi:UDP-N-acetylglucosamine/UDP-N-acetylgalactosamine diphosphorylase